MKILTSNKIVMFQGTIEKGIYEADPSIELYRITNENGVFYAVTERFELIEVESLPTDFVEMKYCYTTEDGFYLNPDYTEYVSDEEKITRLQAQLSLTQQTLNEMLLV